MGKNIISYNPYNWKIHKKEEIPKPRMPLVHNCILDELGFVCTELDMVRLQHAELKKNLEEVERELIRLEDKKLSLIKQLAEHP